MGLDSFALKTLTRALQVTTKIEHSKHFGKMMVAGLFFKDHTFEGGLW